MNKPSTRRSGDTVNTVKYIAGLLLVVGGLNWGLVAIAEFDLVAWLVGEQFGTTNAVSRIIYGLAGLSAVVVAVSAAADRSDAPAGTRSAGSHA
jgi:uncharacterized membrane protein YuzA (DUF378 family)